MEDKKNFGFGTQIRKSPYFNSTVKWGATGFSVYNHMYIPRDFGSPEQNFWNLVNEAILCDVAVERQVEITGPDATKFIQILMLKLLNPMPPLFNYKDQTLEKLWKAYLVKVLMILNIIG